MPIRSRCAELFFCSFLLLATGPVAAQVDLESSHTTASLRGVDVAAPGMVWASGSDGTILRSEDGGYLWQPCTVPKGAAKLDFRGVQGFDAQTAVVMSSGTGDQSKIFKTTDGCQSWKLVFDDPDETGFFDSLRKVTSKQMYLLGDPVGGKFSMFYSPDVGSNWYIADDPGLDAESGAGAFAASNTSLVHLRSQLIAVTGGTTGAHAYTTYANCPPKKAKSDPAAAKVTCPLAWRRVQIPLAGDSAAAGAFSVAARTVVDRRGKMYMVLVAVGGDYQKPNAREGTAAWSRDGGLHWSEANTPPNGYRSAVAYDERAGAWLAVGPNGMDVSFDDARDWSAVPSGIGAQAGSSQGWNAISLPYVVGAKGRIGKLRPEVFKH